MHKNYGALSGSRECAMNKHEKKLQEARLSLNERLLSDGGFAELPRAVYRVDATAWAVIALASAGGMDSDVMAAARKRLTESQLKDGRVTVSKEYPSAFWPTPLAVLAWQGSMIQKSAHARAVAFLLTAAGKHYEKIPNSPAVDDTSIKGWSWIEDSSSWVEPTSLAILALRAAGHESHPRSQEAVKMLMDRQLPHGGWNYGNTIVYGQELYAQPGSTGIALAALAGQVERAQVAKSLDYLTNQAEQCRSPFSLSWALIGLSAWGKKPVPSQAWINESLGLQEKYGSYGTSLLSLLITSFFVDGDISKHIQKDAS